MPKVSKYVAKAPQRILTQASGTRAATDEQLLTSWLANLGSPHTRLNFETTGGDSWPRCRWARAAKVEDVRDALEVVSRGLSEATARQYVLRIKSLLGYTQKLGYTDFNAGATIKVRRCCRGAARSTLVHQRAEPRPARRASLWGTG